MTEAQSVQLAEQYLTSRGFGYSPLAKINRPGADRWEIIFPVPEMLNPNIAVLDPHDVRVLVTPSETAVPS
jgi:hypothetical protein